MNALGRQLSFTTVRASRVCRRRGWNDGCTLPSASWRSLHTRRELPYSIEDGVGDFLSPNALKTVVEWQDGLLNKLNEQVKGTSYANKSVLQAIIGTAGVEEKILTYNYACLAANNNFFLDNLKPPPQREMSPEFSGILKVQYKDLDHLKEEFIASAMGMASSGWLWLVTDGQNRLTVLPTFGAGTLLVRSGHELPQSEESSVINSSPTASLPHKAFSPSLGVFPSPHDGPPPSSPVSGISSTPPSLNSHSPSRTFHTSIARPAIKNPSVTSFNAQNALDLAAIRKRALTIGAKVYPLMCLSIHEHAWISGGLGVWGKEEYVRRFFSVVNWSKVSDTFQKFHASPLSTRTVR